MGTEHIEAAINYTAEKKEDLRKAFADLQSFSSSLVSFTLQWKDIEDHFSSIEKSIEERFRELKKLDSSSAVKNAVAILADSRVEVNQDNTVVVPRLELKTLCLLMDGKGLRSFIINNRKDITAIRRELGPALLSAPDPAKLVLDSLDGFFPPEKLADVDLVAIRRTCLTLLECFHDMSLEIRPLARERARGLAVEWRKLLSEAKGDTSLVVLGVLHLVATFGLVTSFEVDDILDLIVLVARRKNIIDLCRSAKLHENIPDLVEKLNNSGKQLDAVKFVIAFNLTDKFPPASLLNAYVKESKKTAQELRKKGNHSAQSQNEASSKEIAALRAVAKIVEEYNLGSVYSCENFQKRIEQLEKQKAEKKPDKKMNNQKAEMKPEKKRGAASNSNFRGQKQQYEQSNKRPRSSASASTVRDAHPFSHNTQLGLVDLAPHAGFSGSYPLSTASTLYNHGGASLSSGSVGLGGSLASSRYIPSESMMDSAFYDRAVHNDSYAKSGLRPPYHSGFYY
ncbi:FRIGIDA-like protein 2 [Phalaenopsis equestris]|uniref:FRIGIDA-like protein 2 n=1 Tax=Phalaenopsis equestris TaxID=78828 RepID=UPI0009E24960|nr:FRIGIDA-like protein 2 [Phalaenopsis equestris]